MGHKSSIKLNTDFIKDRMAALGISNQEMSRRLGRSLGFTRGMIIRGTCSRVVLPLIANILETPSNKLILSENEKPAAPEKSVPQAVTVNIDTEAITELLERIAKNEVNTASSIRTLHETIREQDQYWRKQWAGMVQLVAELKEEVQLLRYQISRA